MIETMKISGYEKYEVSSTGLVSRNGRALKPQKTDRGYLVVFLGAKQKKRLHRIVAEAFIPNPNALPDVNHLDGNKENNRVENLEWSSRRSNIRHSYETGLNRVRFGDESPRSILTSDQVAYIRSVYINRHSEFGQSALGRKFGVSPGCIWRVVHGRNW